MSSLFTCILVGVDDSQPALDAVALAAGLARRHGGRLILCHAVNWTPLVAQTETPGAHFDPALVIEGLKEQGEALLSLAADVAQRFGVEAELRLVDGEPAKSILALAAQERCPLIAVGTRGRHGLGRLFIGSTAQAVLRGSTVPVLTVRSGSATTHLPGRFERVVVGIDNSEPSSAAIQTVLEFAPEDGAELTFCTVMDVDREIGTLRQFNTDIVRAELREETDGILDEAMDRARQLGFSAKAKVVEGNPVAGLLHFADQDRADLIVVGSHGRRGLKRFFLGSVAESVVQSAHVPVLVVRTALSPALPVALPGSLELAPV